MLKCDNGCRFSRQVAQRSGLCSTGCYVQQLHASILMFMLNIKQPLKYNYMDHRSRAKATTDRLSACKELFSWFKNHKPSPFTTLVFHNKVKILNLAPDAFMGKTTGAFDQS